MKKVTDLKENEVIHVRTEEEDLAIRKLMHQAGLRWWTGDSYFEQKRGEKYPKVYLPIEGAWGYPDNLGDGYTIYPASDFLEPNLEFLAEQLKKIAESKGMKAEIVLSKIDIWDGVEFCKHVSGKHYKIDRIENQYIFTSDGSVLIDANCEPVSEEVYVNWLKSEVVRRFGEIKVWDRFIEPKGDEWAIRKNFKSCGNDEWDYEKGFDKLWYYSLVVYHEGKWAERVKEKVEWLATDRERNNRVSFEFLVPDKKKVFDDVETGKYLAKKLQKYLNRKK